MLLAKVNSNAGNYHILTSHTHLNDKVGLKIQTRKIYKVNA